MGKLMSGNNQGESLQQPFLKYITIIMTHFFVMWVCFI